MVAAADLRNKDIPALKQELSDLLRQQFKLRLIKASGELKKHHQVKQVRRDIARVMTVLTEKEGEK